MNDQVLIYQQLFLESLSLAHLKFFSLFDFDSLFDSILILLIGTKPFFFFSLLSFFLSSIFFLLLLSSFFLSSSSLLSFFFFSLSLQSFILIECGQKIPIEQSFHFMECVFAHIHPKRFFFLEIFWLSSYFFFLSSYFFFLSSYFFLSFFWLELFLFLFNKKSYFKLKKRSKSVNLVLFEL